MSQLTKPSPARSARPYAHHRVEMTERATGRLLAVVALGCTMREACDVARRLRADIDPERARYQFARVPGSLEQQEATHAAPEPGAPDYGVAWLVATEAVSEDLKARLRAQAESPGPFADVAAWKASDAATRRAVDRALAASATVRGKLFDLDTAALPPTRGDGATEPRRYGLGDTGLAGSVDTLAASGRVAAHV